MTSQLQQYLSGDYHADKQELDRIETLIRNAAGTLSRLFDETIAWRYQEQAPLSSVANSSVKLQPPHISHSTSSMVAVALERARPHSEIVLGPNPLPYAAKETKTVIEETKHLVSRAMDIIARDILSDGSPKIKSSTYGELDDPISTYFVLQLCSIKGSNASPDWVRIHEHCKATVKKLCSIKDFLSSRDFWNPPDIADRSPLNALVPLRVVQSNLLLKESDRSDTSHFAEYFEYTLHKHLSFSSIPDSRFDVAQIAFCLEGLLKTEKGIVDRTLLSRVIEVFSSIQKTNPYWRPATPLISTQRGLSLFPVSVEVANSLMRSCETYDDGNTFGIIGSDAVDLFRRYCQWIVARVCSFKTANGDDIIGWSSDNINSSSIIHTWETSQVLDFLVSYRKILQDHISSRTLKLSHFNVKPYTTMNKKEDWSQISAQYEPVFSLGKKNMVYDRLGNEFLKPWIDGKPENYSMLLFGPPGTGKTTISENLAKGLGWRIINISVNDFLARGGDVIESTAKDIFSVLMEQKECVVLFDEIDQLILDRDGERYNQQQGIFQFLTPGMLTKLNDLRAEKRIIFVIATNYANRIDSAIKRAGRIDQQYLVLPPDRLARKRILEKAIDEKCGDRLRSTELSIGDWGKLQSASVFLAFKDISGAIESVQKDDLNVEAFVNALKMRPRTISLGMYETSLVYENSKERSKRRDTPPVEEYLSLLALGLEAEGQIPWRAKEKAVFKAACELLRGQDISLEDKFQELLGKDAASILLKLVPKYLLH